MTTLHTAPSDEASDDVEVSVVVVNWNTRALLEQTLRTLYEHPGSGALQVIVVDNGSTDGSAAMVRSRWPDVTLVELPRNVGLTAGNNIGFRHTRGRYVLLLNSDVVVLPTTVAGLVDCLDRRPDAGCAGARHLNADGSLQRSIDRFPGLLADLLSYSELYRLPWVTRNLARRYPWWGDHDRELEVGWVNGACLMVRREVLEQVGGLDEDFFIYGEELDWCYRMWQAGWTVVFTPAAEVVHLGGQAMDAASADRVVLLHLGQLRFYAKHYPPSRVIGLRLGLTLIALVRMAAIAVFAFRSAVGRPASPQLWELVTHERIRTSWTTMAAAWWRIATLTPRSEARL